MHRHCGDDGGVGAYEEWRGWSSDGKRKRGMTEMTEMTRTERKRHEKGIPSCPVGKAAEL